MQEIIKYQELDGKLRKLIAELDQKNYENTILKLEQGFEAERKNWKNQEKIAADLLDQFQRGKGFYDDYVNKLEDLVAKIDAYEGEKSIELEKTIKSLYAKAESFEKDIATLAKRMNAVLNDAKLAKKNASDLKAKKESIELKFKKEKELREPEIVKLKKELENQKAKVNSALLSKYNAKVDSKLGVIFVPEVNGRCGRCNMEISASRLSELKKNKIVECENCGRYIYLKD